MSTKTSPATALSAEDLTAYRRDGFIVVQNLIPESAVDALRKRIRDYTHGDRTDDGISYQVEPRVERGEISVDQPGDGIRKIGGLVSSDDLYGALGLGRPILDIIEQILGPDLKMFRNAMLVKPPDVGSQKGMHQDSPYWPIEPMDLCSCWFAVDDATEKNGCIGVLPGWHNRGPLPHEAVTDDFVMPEDSYDVSDMVMAPVRAGGAVFFHSLLPHYTAPNRSSAWRRAIVLSYMSARSRYTRDGEEPKHIAVQGETYPGCVR